MASNSRLRILIVTPSLPYPLIWGFGIRVYQIIKYLAARHDVSVIAHAAPHEHDKVEALQQTGARIYPVLRPEASTASKRQAQLTSLFSPASFQRQSQTSAAMQAMLDQVLGAENFDIVQVESSQLAGYRFRSSAALLVDEHNIEYELLYRTFRTEPSPTRKLFNWAEYHKFRREEQASWRHANGCILTSAREEQILHRVAPHPATLVVPNGVDTDSFQAAPGPRDPDRAVFVGVMHYRPNVDAVLYFAREILPRLLRDRPNFKFTVVGGGAPDELRQLAGPNLEFTDVVPDTRPYLAQAGAVVVPVRMGSGTRLKVLEALAMSSPMVSTSVGCEGIDVVDGQHLLIADEPDLFAAQVLRAVSDPQLGQHLADNGRALAEGHYSWASLLPTLEAFMHGLARQPLSQVRTRPVPVRGPSRT